jgi:CheY-like chemotaxis protein
MKISRPAKLVVVIEDDPLVLEATGSLLRSWGFDVLAARCFSEARTQLEKMRRRPDLIVSDYRLSRGETGIEAIERLRDAFEIPALLITGDAACPTGQDDASYQMLQKPVNAERFRAALLEACTPRL